MGAAFSLLGPAVSVVGVAFAGVSAVVGALLSPIGLVVTAVGGLGALFLTQTEAGQAMTSRIGQGFREVADVATTAWGGIVAAFKKGDLGAVWNVVCATLKVAWAGTILFLQERWVWFKGIFVDGFKDVVAGVKLLFYDAAAWIVKVFAKVVFTIVDAAASVLDAVGLESLAGRLNAISDGFDPNKINERRDAIKREIVLERQKEQAEANAAREADLAGARQRLAEAKAALNGAVADAKNPGAAALKKGELDVAQHLREKGIGRLADAVKGGFNANRALGQFGYNDKVSQQTELMKRLVNGEGPLANKIGAAVAQNLRLH